MQNIAVLIPCYNEELTVRKVIEDFRANLPEAEIYIYDNNSTDKTAQIVLDYIKDNADGKVFLRKEFRQGKGFVVQSMFSEINADVYVMTDGDDTYPAEQVRELIAPVLNEKCDMCVGDRLSNGTYSKENKRPAHDFGNNLVRALINLFFKAELHDIMSGYRAFSKRFVKNYPVLSKGFEIETEMTLHALDKGFNVREVPII
ncbi:MAG: glycosyltransferase family 2 protein, partial [Synergistaceae bacterium]|nr:glycosyltransferase family 2 protein [Synergistaceae bacterium]